MAGNISFYIDLKSTDKLAKDILNEMATVMQRAITGALTPIDDGIKNLITQAFKLDSTYNSILSGEIQKIFLLVAPANTLNYMLDTIINSIRIKQRTVRQVNGLTLSGGLDINIFDDQTYLRLLNAPEGSFVTANGFLIPWFEHILDGGTTPLFTGAELVDTGKGIVLSKQANNIQIPAQFSGQKDNNFITKTLLGLEDNITDLIYKEVDSRI